MTGTRKVASLDLIFDGDDYSTVKDRTYTDQNLEVASVDELMDSAPEVHDDRDPMGSIIDFLSFNLSRNSVEVPNQEEQEHQV